MILDAQNLFSDAQALTSTGASTNIVDHGADRNLGIGEPLALVIVVDVAPDATTGDETYAAQLQTDDNSGFGSPASVGASITIARTTAAGTKFVQTLPPDTSMERFSRVNFTLGGTTPSITVTAFLVPLKFVQNELAYADAITITG